MELTPEVMQELAASAEGIPIYLDRRNAEIEDPSGDLKDHHWQPACTTTSKLTRCLEAIRDISSALAPLVAAERPAEEKRLIKQLITPIFSFAVAIRDLFNDVQSNCWADIRSREQQKLKLAFQAFGKEVPTTKGALKTARDKIAAHLDKDTCTSAYRQFWEVITLEGSLKWIRGCMRMLEPLLTPDIYSWTRASEYSNVVKMMNVDSSEVSLLIAEGKPKAILDMQIAESPKYGIVRECQEVAKTCFGLFQRLGVRQGTTWKLPQ